MYRARRRQGTSLIDLLISMAIIAVLFGGIYLIYFALITAISNISVRSAATAAIQGEIETIRNLPYASVGTIGGIPAGVLARTQSVSVGGFSFVLTTEVRNIDDPFDGTVTGTPPPADTAPADYKLVQIEATCPLCTSYFAVRFSTTVAPKNLESAPQNGSLFLFAIDANGQPVPGATLRVVNASVTPSVDFTDTTNASGALQLVGVPTSSQNYRLIATKAGYSTDRTYPPGGAGNPNPVRPDATVAAETVTSATFSIDQVSTLTVRSSDNRCVAVGNQTFALTGAKLIGTNPIVYKYSAAPSTDAQGLFSTSSLEWDTYSFLLTSAAYNLAGTIPQNPLVVDPHASATMRLVVQPAANPSLLVTAVDSASGAGIPGASITVSRPSFTETLVTGHAFVSDNTWAGSQYEAQSGGLDVDSVPGEIQLLVNASGTYDENTNAWLISNTWDLGGSAATLYGFSWTPAALPGGTSIKFQVAASDDNTGWNFVGPDGSSATYFTAVSSSLPASLNGHRYFKYKVYLNTTDQNKTPAVSEVSLEFAADCVPPSQALFTNLGINTYTVAATAADYYEASTTVAIGADATSTVLPLIHL